jgi:hypothetical protein
LFTFNRETTLDDASGRHHQPILENDIMRHEIPLSPECCRRILEQDYPAERGGMSM